MSNTDSIDHKAVLTSKAIKLQIRVSSGPNKKTIRNIYLVKGDINLYIRYISEIL
jgi:hypothetical protein